MGFNKMTVENVCGIAKFVERDIDMLLAEELRVNPEFSRWIMERFTETEPLKHPAVSSNVSVVEDGSEADVVATFESLSGGTHRLFVENKIDAVLMPEQLERYVRRGEGEVRRGSITGYSVLFFTPSSYLKVDLPSGVRQLSFEEAAQTLGENAGLRSAYRASLLLRAIPHRAGRERDEHVAQTAPFIKEWWDTVYAMVEREFPGCFRHQARYPRSVFYAPETPEQARYIRLDLKGHKGEVDLAFKSIDVNQLKNVISTLPDCPGRLIENPRSSAIRIDELEPFVISDGLGIIETKVRAAYCAAHKLLAFWRKHRESFDELAARLPEACE